MTRECPYGLGDWDLRQFQSIPVRKGISEVQLSHTAKSTSAVFDDPNLVGSAGLVPVMGLAARAGLADLADRLLSVPTDKGANAG